MLLFDFLQRLQGNRFVPKADIAIVLMNVCFVRNRPDECPLYPAGSTDRRNTF
jgi:hypothetical protein